MNPEQERRMHHEGLVNLQPPEYEPPLDPLYGKRPVARPFWFVLAATLSVVGVAALGIWWLTS